MNLFEIIPIFIVISLNFNAVSISGHGMVLNPVNRGSIWRFKEFSSNNPPVNMMDNYVYCDVQDERGISKRCAPCGDDIAQRQPRDNEGGGRYGRGIIVKKYQSGQMMDVLVNLTTTHGGYMEFRLCDQNNPNKPETQQCFNKYLLRLDDGRNRIPVNEYEYTNGVMTHKEYNLKLRLPPGLKCSHCVMQWQYQTARTYCQKPYFSSCGPYVKFRGCSDISIE